GAEAGHVAVVVEEARRVDPAPGGGDRGAGRGRELALRGLRGPRRGAADAAHARGREAEEEGGQGPARSEGEEASSASGHRDLLRHLYAARGRGRRKRRTRVDKRDLMRRVGREDRD